MEYLTNVWLRSSRSPLSILHSPFYIVIGENSLTYFANPWARQILLCINLIAFWFQSDSLKSSSFIPIPIPKTPLHPKSEAIYGAPKMISALLSASKIVKGGGFLGMGTCTGWSEAIIVCYNIYILIPIQIQIQIQIQIYFDCSSCHNSAFLLFSRPQMKSDPTTSENPSPFRPWPAARHKNSCRLQPFQIKCQIEIECGRTTACTETIFGMANFNLFFKIFYLFSISTFLPWGVMNPFIYRARYILNSYTVKSMV